MSDIPLEDETGSVEEIIAAARNVINSWSPQFTAEEVLAVARERDQALQRLEDVQRETEWLRDQAANGVIRGKNAEAALERIRANLDS